MNSENALNTEKCKIKIRHLDLRTIKTHFQLKKYIVYYVLSKKKCIKKSSISGPSTGNE